MESKRMRRWLSGLACALLLMPASAGAARLDPAVCALTGLATGDNDIRLDTDSRPPGRPIPVPSPVADQVRAAAVQMLARTSPEVAEDLDCSDLLRPVFRIRGFGGDELRHSCGADHSRRTGMPPAAGGRWSARRVVIQGRASMPVDLDGRATAMWSPIHLPQREDIVRSVVHNHLMDQLIATIAGRWNQCPFSGC